MQSNLARAPRKAVELAGGPRGWIAAVWLVLALSAQISVLHLLRVHDVVPSVVLVVVVWYAMRVDARRAALYGLAAGLCEDVMSAVTGGAWTIATTVVAAIIGVLSRGFFADSMPVAAGMTAFATLVRAGLFWSVMALQGYPAGLGGRHFHDALIEAVLNACLMIVAMWIARRIESRTA